MKQRLRIVMVAAGLCWASIFAFASSPLGPAQAAAQACEGDRLVVTSPLPERWSRALPSLCDLLRDLPDADRGARLTLRPAGRDLIATVSLSDGRVTSRRIDAPSELLSTVEALIVVPPSLAPEVRPTEPEQHRAPAPRDEEVPSAPVTRSATRKRLVRLDLGANLMSRIEGAPAYLSLGVQSFAAVRVWSVSLALAVRWDGFQSVVRNRPRHLEMSTEGGGVWALYRLVESPELTVDAGLAVWVLAVMQTHGEGDAERGGTVADVRSGPMVRAQLGSRALRTAVGLDLELSRRRLHDNLRLDDELPTLPSWGLGLTVGVVWST